MHVLDPVNKAPPGLHHLSNFPSGMHDLGPCESGGPGWPMATSSMAAIDTVKTEELETGPCCAHPKTKHTSNADDLRGRLRLALRTGLHRSHPGAAPVPLQQKKASSDSSGPGCRLADRNQQLATLNENQLHDPTATATTATTAASHRAHLFSNSTSNALHSNLRLDARSGDHRLTIRRSSGHWTRARAQRHACSRSALHVERIAALRQSKTTACGCKCRTPIAST